MIGILIGHRFDAVLAPQQGVIPDCVGSWEPKLQVQWFAKYLRELTVQHHAVHAGFRTSLQLDTYYVTSERHKGVCCLDCSVAGGDLCPQNPRGKNAYECCHKDHSLVRR